MPRVSKSSTTKAEGVPEKTFILDNGAYTIKAGFAPTNAASNDESLRACDTFPNYIVRTRDKKVHVAAQCDEITQWSEAVFRRPIEHGQLVNWEAQKEIWDRSLFDKATATSNTFIEAPEETTIILTETPNTMPALQKNADEIIMEEWGFGGYLRTVGSSLNAYNDLHPVFEDAKALTAHPAPEASPMECLLVVDSGYSYTTVTPVYNGRPLQRAIRRLEFGGKHITNLLKEVVSIRHFDLHQDLKIVNDVKEDVLFVTEDLDTDMERTWKGNRNKKSSQEQLETFNRSSNNPLSGEEVRVDYVLPDGIRILRGYSRPHDPSAAALAARKRKLNMAGPESEVSMTLGNERFSIPEIIFNPANVGSKQPGLADCVIQSLSVLPPLVQATMLANVLVTGGNANIRGFVGRLQAELRALVTTEWMVRVRKLDNPVTSTWLGGARMASKYRSVLNEYAVTKEQYDEYGTAWIARKFVNGSKLET